MVSLKRLLNDDSSDNSTFDTNGSCFQTLDGFNSINVSEGISDRSFTEQLGFGDLDGTVTDSFDDVQLWMNGTGILGQTDSSATDENAVNSSSSTPLTQFRDVNSEETVKVGDICYGMLHSVDVKLTGDMAVLDAKLKPSLNSTPTQRFKLENKTDHIQLTFYDETVFGCLRLNYAKGLSDHLSSPSLCFQAIVGTEALRETIGRASKAADAQVKVDINVYGPPERADEIGFHLSDHKLFLQKPDNLIRGVEYKNPQVLVFEGLDPAIIDKPMEVQEKTRPKPQTEEEHLRQAVKEVYSATTRQDDLAQMTASDRIKTEMLPHQKQALKFMLERESGDIADKYRLWEEVVVDGVTSYQHAITKSKSRVRPDEKGGGILADEMGMGKSLCVLSLIVHSLDDAQRWAEKRFADKIGTSRSYSRSTLIVVSSPLLINNWCQEMKHHLREPLKVVRYHGPNRPKDERGLKALVDSDIVITTYNTLITKESLGNGPKRSNMLHDIEWFRVVLDEAHIIRRQATAFHKRCVDLKANSRWCLTGTPIQNRLEDIGALFCFIKAKPFDAMAQFRRYIVVPFDQNDDEIAIKRLVQLKESLCLRRTKDLLDLPPLHQYVRRLDLNPEERKQYDNTERILFRKIRQKAGEHEQTSKFGIFQANLQLRIMCNHGTFQQPFSWQSERSLRDAREAWISQVGANAQVNCNGCAQPMPVLGSNKLYNDFVEKCTHVMCLECLDDAASYKGSEHGRKHCPLCKVFNHQKDGTDVEMADGHKETRGDDGELDDADYFRPSGYSTKMNALISDVQQDLSTRKSIIFSCWTRTLNLIARHLDRAKIPFSRIDGECPLSRRQQILEDFANKADNRVLIMTTGTGAFGLNLTCANRVFIVELQWNPSVESQAIARAIRLGQEVNVSVIRYIMNNTVEQDMQSQQERKLRMAQKGFEDDMETD